MPPALNIPQRIADLTAVQIGDRVEIEFTLPSLTTEGIALKTLGGVDLRAGVASKPFKEDQWAESAKVMETSPEQPGRVKKTLSAKEWANREIVIAVRALSARGRTSGWSNFVTMTVVDPLAKPTLKAESDAAGAKLSWDVKSPVARLFRKTATEKEPTQIAEVQNGTEFVDVNAEYGKPYEYSVTAWNGTARSEASDTVALTPVDTFAPPPPDGLRAIAGVNTIELAWDRVADVADLRGYRVYRSVEGGAFERLTERAEVPSFSDKTAPAGKRCWYAVTAFDVAGNESPRSAAVEIVVP
jgi:fibronectin type 3 domain-containing protein